MMNNEPEYEVLKEIWEITEYRDGCVYKTRYLRDDWVPMGDSGDKAKGLIYCPTKTWTPPRRKGGDTR